MSKEEIIDVVLEAYAHHPGVKDYFGFFLNPDVRQLTEKYEKRFEKELSRIKRGRCRARISVIKKGLKEYAAYGVEPQANIDLRLYAIRLSLLAERRAMMLPPMLKGVEALIDDTMKIADSAMLFAQTRQRIDEMLNDPKYCHSNFCRSLRDKLKIY